MVTNKPYLAFIAVLSACFVGPAFHVGAADIRTEPIDAYILIDTSAAMGQAVSDATRWICDTVVDGMLIDGDRLSVWTYSSGSSRVMDRLTLGGDGKEKAKADILRITGDGRAPNVGAALRKLIDEAESRPDRRSLAYLLVASSLVETGNMDTERLLKRSRVRELPGWKAVVIGVGSDEKAREGAQAYFDAVGSP